MRIKGIIVAILLCLSFNVQAALKFPMLTGRVVDNANIITPQTRTQLESLLAAHERQTTNQIVVVTLPSLQGYEIADFGYQLGRHWGIGTKEKNNGVLFIIAPNERQTRIEVGYGLEGELTDALTKSIIENDIIPFFKQENYAGGILQGAKSIVSAAEGAYKIGVPHNRGITGSIPQTVIMNNNSNGKLLVPIAFCSLFFIMLIAGTINTNREKINVKNAFIYRSRLKSWFLYDFFPAYLTKTLFKYSKHAKHL